MAEAPAAPAKRTAAAPAPAASPRRVLVLMTVPFHGDAWAGPTRPAAESLPSHESQTTLM
ncbi:hypothetical protein [Ornithinimicrobium kibberense]|uniref:hypothetical protein n=1 Tax=Ornithinimicrobium kibberense TaxID=282060 RepID=UPI00361D0390